jgi:hypothetical protein
MQCGLFTFDEERYTAEEAAALTRATASMHLLLTDVSHERTVQPWRPHWHYVPYKVRPRTNRADAEFH